MTCSEGISNTTGYIARDDSNKLIIIAIQGTSVSTNPSSVLSDIDLIRVKTNLCGTANTHDGCEIHMGFWIAATDIQVVVMTNLALAMAANPSYKTVTTGHSLGGAVAALLGAWLRNKGIIVDIVSAVSHYRTPC